MKKMLIILLAMVMSLSLVACGGDEGVETGGEDTKLIGVAMPTQSAPRWIEDGNNMKNLLEEKGYEVDLQFAEDIVENQISQIENMITKEVDVLIIASIDGEALTDVLSKAAEQGIPVIAYDRLLMNSEHVDYYATFDNFQVGVEQGNYIVDKMGLEDGNGPYNIELFGGSPDDNNAYFFYDGAMSVLQPYIDNGQLVVKSGQMGMDVVSTLRWDAAKAQSRMDNILTAHYTTDKVDIILSPYDPISLGVISSLKGVGYGTEDLPLPLITGQDADIPGVKSIIAREQTQTIFKDTRELAKVAVEMCDAVLTGEEAPVNDTETYDNGVKVVPSYLLAPVSVDIDNYREVLIDSGYYTEEDLGL
ncbi:multiple monosaccharide ABC transporter substrate-binding protein [Schnuerera sp. xch1]|uniref:multiple monosaccharide ABC transporter substrate-binding protein n=1 Tax=Schnuerera sp. xch1 TaxID=2874283 RepID=UPI0029587024|nr:multiple monosaccharide ABC transporter substrate-binding protein [Schnuerera sp. xch1]